MELGEVATGEGPRKGLGHLLVMFLEAQVADRYDQLGSCVNPK